MTNELLQKAKECKSAEELLALAKDNGIEMTQEEAEKKFAQLNNEGELSDDELSSAAGGGCTVMNGIAMPDRFPKVGQVFTAKRRVTKDVHLPCSKCGSIYFRCTSFYEPNPAKMTAGCFYGSCTNCGREDFFAYSEDEEDRFTVVFG